MSLLEPIPNHKYPPFCVFVSGGLNGNTLHKQCEIFYPLEGAWNATKSMKQARCGHIAQYMGATEWKCMLDGPSGEISMVFDEWKDISDLSTKIFVAGGHREHGNVIRSSECFDVDRNEWTMCQRAPFSNHGYQSGCWWTRKQCVAMVSDPMEDVQGTGGCQVALYNAQRNKWNVIGRGEMDALGWNDIGNDLGSQMGACDGRGRLKLKHFYPGIGTVHLFGQEYLYVMGDDYRFQHMELYDERADLWIPVGLSVRSLQSDDCIQQKRDELLYISRNRQFDAFVSTF